MMLMRMIQLTLVTCVLTSNGLVALAPSAQAQSQSTLTFKGRLSAKNNPQRPEQPTVFHLKVTESGSNHGRDISLFQCGSVSPEEMARRINRIVTIRGHFSRTGADTDGFCTTELSFSPADGELTELPQLMSAVAISADNSVIVGNGPRVGQAQVNGRAFKYSAGEYTDLGNLGGEATEVFGVSADGSVIVGWSTTDHEGARAFRYSGRTMTNLGSLGGNWSRATGVSGDGKVIVGSSMLPDGSIHAFRYSDGEMADLGNLGGTKSYATAVSANGLVTAGYIVTSSNQHVPFSYSNGKVTRLYEGSWDSEPTAVSADGSVVVGWRTISVDGRATVIGVIFSKGQMIDFDNDTRATGVSADGSIVVGKSDTRAFVYAGGSRTDLTLPSTAAAAGVSPDGRTIVGTLFGAIAPTVIPSRGFVFQ